MSNNTKLSIENMNLHYGSFHALKDINMHIPEKEITALSGLADAENQLFLNP